MDDVQGGTVGDETDWHRARSRRTRSGCQKSRYRLTSVFILMIFSSVVVKCLVFEVVQVWCLEMLE